MDCQTAIEYINLYADNMLGKKETELLFSHIGSCSKCKKELNDVLAVKQALAGLKEIEPPAGLAFAAIRKAKKRRAPIFAYASAGVAAVIALVAIFSSSIFNDSGDIRIREAAYSGQYSKSMATNAPMQEAACATEAPAADIMLAPEAEDNGAVAASSEPQSDNMESMLVAPREASVPYINVPADISDKFKESLVAFLEDNNIDYQNYVNGSNDTITISFTITEDKLDALKVLIDEGYQYIDEAYQYKEQLSAGTIQFIFNK